MVGAFLIASIIQEYLEEGFYLHRLANISQALVLTASEAMVSITCLEFAYKEAPKIMKSLVMAIFLLTVSLGITLHPQLNFFLPEKMVDRDFRGAEEFWFWTILMATVQWFICLFPACTPCKPVRIIKRINTP